MMRTKFYLMLFVLVLFVATAYAQQSDELELVLDLNSNTTPLPNILRPGIDLSGRGFHRQADWPQGLAAQEALGTLGNDIGFSYIYRLQYNLWQIHQLSKDKEAQEKLLNNYEEIIKKISAAGGIVILDIFGTPPGLGKVLDKKSPPVNLRAFKELIKARMRYFSCEKRYNIWYEVWSAPDLDDFFLGRKQEYLNLYRAVAESAKELSQESKVYIPVGGPGASWWFQNCDGNTAITPERSLIYELIKFCSRYRLPLNFITWHAYSTDPKAEKENTVYKKPVSSLIRDWLSYFGFERNTPLLVDEWNYDSGANFSPSRGERSYICASYIFSRIKNMYEAGIDYQIYFCLEDFQNNKEGVTRNVGLFSFDSESSGYKGASKAGYNVLKMLPKLGNQMFEASLKPKDEFADALAAKSGEQVAVIIYNYIDPDIGRNYLSRNVADLNGQERKMLLNLVASHRLEKVLSRQLEIKSIRGLSKKLKGLLAKAQELKDKAAKFSSTPRNINIGIKNIKGNYLYQRYAVDESCGRACASKPLEEKELVLTDTHREIFSLAPYSVQMILFTKKPEEPAVTPAAESPAAEVKDTQPAGGAAN